jgi:hypothetical protein
VSSQLGVSSENILVSIHYLDDHPQDVSRIVELTLGKMHHLFFISI